ncbi:MAG: substrate-binding periplasmic protein [Candidatus Hermodarchaeota archaeon]
MKREIAVVGIIAGIAIGFGLGWFIPPLLTQPEGKPLIDQIKDRGELIVGTSADYPPFENFTWPYTGEIQGFDVNVSQWIADELGVNLVMTHIDFTQLISACKAGTIDMVAAAMTYTEERAESLAPSITYINSSNVVMVKNSSSLTTITDLTDLIGVGTIGCQSGTVFQWDLEDIPGITFTAYPSAIVLMTNLLADNVVAAYVDKATFEYYNRTENLRIIYDSGTEPLSLWTRHGEPELLYVINKVILDAYITGTMSILIDEWFG